MRYFLFIIYCLIGYGAYSQNVKRYKIQAIDSTSLGKYFIVDVAENTGVIRKVFSEKSDMQKGNTIKLGKIYCLKLSPIELKFENMDSVKIRGNYSIFIGSKEILAAGEQSFKSENLRGLVYILSHKK